MQRLLRAMAVVPLMWSLGCEGQMGIFADSPMNMPNTQRPVDSPDPVATETGFIPGPPTLRKLTAIEYRNTIEEAFGMGFVVDFTLPEDQTTNGMTAIAMASTAISPLGVEQYETAGYEVARLLTETPSLRQTLVNCDGSQIDAGCYTTFLQEYGRKLWRRDLTEPEVTRYAQSAEHVGTTLGSFWQGLEFAIAGLLQSPHFLYRTEYGESDPERPGLRKLTGLEIASKLSYLITGRPPTTYTLSLAAAGQLNTPAEIRAEAERMLANPHTRDNFGMFWIEYFGLQNLEKVTKDTFVYRDYSTATAQSMREETMRVMEYLVFEQNADMRDMFTTTTTFVDSRLATIYRLEGITGSQFQQITLPASANRAGILGHGSVLALHSHSVTTSPSHRGKFIREALMCQALPPPPPNASTVIPDADPAAGPQTFRQRLEDYFDNPACGSCHKAMDSLGFGLENYDAIGRWRVTDNELPVDATGELNGIPFSDGVSLGAAIAQDPATMDCMVRKTYRHVVGRVEGAGDKPLVEELRAGFVASGYKFKDLVLNIAGSEAFLVVQEVVE